MSSSVLLKADRFAQRVARGAERGRRANARAQRQARRRRARGLDLQTQGLQYTVVDELIADEDLPEDLTDELRSKALRKALRQTGMMVRDIIIQEIKAQDLDSKKVRERSQGKGVLRYASRDRWSKKTEAYHTQNLARKQLKMKSAIMIKVINDKKEQRIVLLVGPESRKYAWYAWFLEFGWKPQWWGRPAEASQPPRPFMRPAIAKAQPKAEAALVRHLKEFFSG